MMNKKFDYIFRINLHSKNDYITNKLGQLKRDFLLKINNLKETDNVNKKSIRHKKYLRNKEEQQ